MRIRKAYQGTVPENKILDTYSTSQTDTYSCNFVNKANTYSTSEVDTGMKWIDGRSIYRKVFSFTTGGSEADLGINHNISNFDVAINVYGYVEDGNNGCFPIPNSYRNMSSTYAFFIYRIDSTSIVLSYGSHKANRNGYVVLEYIKKNN